eukprot:SAG31_NODE_20485_length_573_cov_0.833333_1_plen_137_part_01
MIIRSSSNPVSTGAEIKHPGAAHQTNITDATFAAYRELYSCSGKNASWLRQRLDLDTYMKWLAFNSILHNGDYIDEAFFYDKRPPDSGGPPHWSVHAWDLDAVFTRCHVPTSQVVGRGTYTNMFCAETHIDRCIYED